MDFQVGQARTRVQLLLQKNRDRRRLLMPLLQLVHLGEIIQKEVVEAEKRIRENHAHIAEKGLLVEDRVKKEEDPRADQNTQNTRRKRTVETVVRERGARRGTGQGTILVDEIEGDTLMTKGEINRDQVNDTKIGFDS